MKSLSPEQIARYQRQLALPGMSVDKQLSLLGSRVVILGIGTSGTVCASYLAGAGVGMLRLVDPGLISLADLPLLTNFHRQDVGQPKVAVVAAQLECLNRDVHLEPAAVSFDPHNAEQLLSSCHLVIDCLDSWQDKLLCSDICMQMSLPLVHAGLMNWSFQVFTMIPARSACLRCVFGRLGLEDPPHPGAGAVDFGPVAGMAGAFQSAEAIQLLCDLGTSTPQRLIRFDALRREFEAITNLAPRPDCPDCGRKC
jgi:molybdopterin/thiamine biosynthesis adenylyltransferase